MIPENTQNSKPYNLMFAEVSLSLMFSKKIYFIMKFKIRTFMVFLTGPFEVKNILYSGDYKFYYYLIIFDSFFCIIVAGGVI